MVPGLLQFSKLEMTPSGFARVNNFYRSLSYNNVFAMGGVCSRENGKVTKSDIQSVTSGSMLAHNLYAVLQGSSLKKYNAKKRPLSVMSCGGRYGIVSRGNITASGVSV